MDWKDKKYKNERLQSKRSLFNAGGRVIKRVGISGRDVIEMPDGSVYEEGLDGDGACYRVDAQR